MTEERFKGWYHGGLLILFAIPLGYNAMRLCVTPQPRHVINVALYGTAVIWELAQMQHHFEARP